MFEIFSNPEFQKLLMILSLLLIIPIGGYFQHKNKVKKEALEEDFYSSSASSSQITQEPLSESEQQIKSYIEDYKSSYSKDSIKEALIQAGYEESKVEEMILKYY